ncbi:glutamyl-tRNA synthetase gltX [Candidatus Kinetoplastibacterium oncopeltii TCC290E]|uniref:Glutamate--tRNA ligase n=2 Tax=Candidatus Kinetoplastidibacterium stringomonadis TaxID=994696 RepID=M1LWZ3_9PROT|nr:glutamate--tRNA ligase [Candidatus Kinetoplastibacterium oncopeltii]AEM25290.1 glutamyl-tRNA synthetase [Candidatus Kinetoplastibacterium oncopeltii]AGF48591.1 glutamyl-tRNA synthetase gltX [Candidatus Kinetoplastibacterium oncopeltii TCC290E]
MNSYNNNTVRVRFAPSPTGFLHLGGARTALFSWAFAKHNNGIFLLRIEDTDIKRSTKEAIKSIIDGMSWLGITSDEEIIYQTQRMDRYRELLKKMLKAGTAYYCYSSTEEIEKMREKARKNGAKPKYDGTWRPELNKTLPNIPEDRNPTIRFKNPSTGIVSWNDLVKGRISFKNEELDDLVIARSDGTPTYNFCVAIDDLDMGISHVLRGDDHVNNTPRQINILKSLNVKIPEYGHLPMILGTDGEKLSKRHGAMNIMEYKLQGYLPEAMVNYLARLGWSHNNDEIFSTEQLIKWFDIKHLSKSPSQWDPKKLDWINSYYIKNKDTHILASMIIPMIVEHNYDPNENDLNSIIDLFKERSNSLNKLAENTMIFYKENIEITDDLKNRYIDEKTIHLISKFIHMANKIEWKMEEIDRIIKTIISENNIIMKQIALPLRIYLTGETNTPSINKVLFLLGKDKVLSRLSKA